MFFATCFIESNKSRTELKNLDIFANVELEPRKIKTRYLISCLSTHTKNQLGWHLSSCAFLLKYLIAFHTYNIRLIESTKLKKYVDIKAFSRHLTQNTNNRKYEVIFLSGKPTKTYSGCRISSLSLIE